MAVTNIKTVVEATVAPQLIALELKYKSALDEVKDIVSQQDKIIGNNATAVGDTQLLVKSIQSDITALTKRVADVEASVATIRADLDKLLASS